MWSSFLENFNANNVKNVIWQNIFFWKFSFKNCNSIRLFDKKWKYLQNYDQNFYFL